MDVAGVHHVAVKVSDLARAEVFYVGVLGLAVLRRWPGADGSERSLWLDLGKGSFLALERSDGPGDAKSENGSGIHLLALQIPRCDREPWIAALAQAGQRIYQQTDFTIYVQDPEGNRVGLSHWPDPV
jgi:glyoxylase I family protein